MDAPIESKNIEGLLIKHVIQDQKSKDEADSKLFNWQLARYTPEKWVQQLDYGYILSPCKYSPKPDGRYTHSGDYFESTHFFFADGDNFIGEKDSTKDAIPSWQDRDEIFIQFPSLRDKLFAFSESVSSMTKDKPYRRYRLIFLFDEAITTRAQFNHVEKLLAMEFPIIPDIDRAPTQPVFGNARKQTSGVEILGNVLTLKLFLDYKIPETTPSLLPAEPHTNGSNLNGHKKIPSPPPQLNGKDMTLDEFIREYRIPTISPRERGGHFVRCPWESQHVSGSNKDKDAYIWENTNGTFAFNCSHATCKKRGNTWALYREAVAPKKHGGSRANSGRKPNLEKAKQALPVKSQKPIVMLNKIISDENRKDVLSDRGRHEVSNEVASVLFNAEKGDNFFRRDRELGNLKADNDSLRFNPHTKDGIAGVIARKTSLQKYRDGDIVEVANPPAWLAADIYENQDTSKLPAIDIILTHPYFNGEALITENGFDASTGAYLNQKAKELDLDTEKHSAKDDIQLWRDWLCDFPFTSESDFENAIAYMLTIMVRPGLPIGEVSPMFLITAPREGVGKTLLADVLTAAVTGIPTETRTLGSKNDEIKKELGAALRTAPEVVVFDNVESSKRLDSAVLASVVTQVRGRFRILGVSEEMSYDNRATMLYTGSNIEMTIELVKRAVAIRLSDTGIAEKDRKVKVESILSETLRKHTEFISSLTRMIKRWIESEKATTEPLHRMRHWSKDIFSILKANDLGDHFLKNTDEVMLTTGGEYTTWANAYKAIAEQLGEQATEGFTASDVFTILSIEDNVYSPQDSGHAGETVFGEGDNILGEYITGNKEHSRKVQLGTLLKSKTGSIFGGYKLIDTHKSRSGGKKIYRLEPVEGQPIPRIPGSEPELDVPKPEKPVNIDSDCPF